MGTRTKSQKEPKQKATTTSTTMSNTGSMNVYSEEHASPPRPKRRKTAQEMAKRQKEIAVSEFFAKNRHLLGFDNPRKALLTAVKEAVDNSLDACEDAGILPQIHVEIHLAGENRYRVVIQDNGPGIVKSQIPNIFGKLLYGSKFHRLRQSRGQQGIGISAAGMYGLLTTGTPIKVTSRTSARKPAYYCELQIDTKRNKPEIIKDEDTDWEGIQHGTRVEIALEARFQRGRQSVEDYLLQTAIANPHVTISYIDPFGKELAWQCVSQQLPDEPKEIKPHPYGIELGILLKMLQETEERSLKRFLTRSFSRVSSAVANRIVENAGAGLTEKSYPTRIAREEIDRLYAAIQKTKISAPSVDCLSPIGSEMLEAGLRQVIPNAGFYAAHTRPPAVYRGNPFQIETAICYGGNGSNTRVDRQTLDEMITETDDRTIRRFLMNSFSGIGPSNVDSVIKRADLSPRSSPKRLKESDLERLHTSLQREAIEEKHPLSLLRYANRVPLLYQQSSGAVQQAVSSVNWRAYGLPQSRGSLPTGPITLVVHIASVWVPFTSESKEAIASYPEIIQEVKLAVRKVGLALKSYLALQRRSAELKRKNQYIEKYIPHIGIGLRELLDLTDLEVQALTTTLRDTLERSRKL